MSFLSEYWPYLTVVAGAVCVVLALLYTTRTRKEKSIPLEVRVKERKPLTAEHSVMPDEARRARDELRILGLEREIHSYAIRRLYEAETEGKISEEERERLARGYRERMERIKDTITRSGSIVTLHELETMQDDLLKLFSDRFDDLTQKIEELRSHLEIKLEKEETLSPPTTLSPDNIEKEDDVTQKQHPAPRKTEAEERIEKIRGEIEKVLERLEQIEIEEQPT